MYVLKFAILVFMFCDKKISFSFSLACEVKVSLSSSCNHVKCDVNALSAITINGKSHTCLSNKFLPTFVSHVLIFVSTCSVFLLTHAFNIFAFSCFFFTFSLLCHALHN